MEEGDQQGSEERSKQGGEKHEELTNYPYKPAAPSLCEVGGDESQDLRESVINFLLVAAVTRGVAEKNPHW